MTLSLRIKGFGFILLIFFAFTSLSIPLSGQCDNKQLTVILSLDGFRWDYPDKTETPTLDRISTEGVKAVSLIPSFPSKTFPNHYTLATGLYPDHHGIVNNSFYDPGMKKPYSMGNKESRFEPAFYGGEPIWITARKQGVLTASFYWVGSDVPIQGMHPDYWKVYDGKVPFSERIDTVIKWISLPQEHRPRLVMLYYEEPDHSGHDFGPGDIRTLSVVHEVDSIAGILYDKIRSLPEGDNVNLIIVSDHGMGPSSSDRNIVLNDYIPGNWKLRIEGGNPNFNIYGEGQWIDSAYNSLKRAPHIKVWKPDEIPAYLNYGKNPKDGDIIAVADSGWSLTLKKPLIPSEGGAHGYEINNTDMHAIFYAAGPAFKVNYIHPSFRNVDIYPLLAHLLGIVPAQNDGDIREVIDMLKSPQPR